MLSAMEFWTMIVISFSFTYFILSSLARHIKKTSALARGPDEAWLIRRNLSA